MKLALLINVTPISMCRLCFTVAVVSEQPGPPIKHDYDVIHLAHISNDNKAATTFIVQTAQYYI